MTPGRRIPAQESQGAVNEAAPICAQRFGSTLLAPSAIGLFLLRCRTRSPLGRVFHPIATRTEGTLRASASVFSLVNRPAPLV